jgi:glycosyltransferase involved in cell wall biosynthesis
LRQADDWTFPLRILHVISSLDPKHGGPPVIAASLASAQVALGHDVVLATLDRPTRRDAIDRSMSRLPGFSRVDVRWLTPQRSTPINFLKAVLIPSAPKALSGAVRHAEMVHLHSVWDVLIYAAARECRRSARPYCVLLNGMLDPWCLGQKKWKKRLALALGYRRMLDRAAFLHLGNEDERRLIEPLGLRAPTEILPNGIFPDDIDPLPRRGSFFATHPFLRDRPFVLFISRLHYKKGLDYLADAFEAVARRFGDVQLVVAGPDDGEKGSFEQRIARHGLGDRVHVIGPLYGPEKFAALVDCACFCLPSRQEGFSMAVTEALACGVPAVISEGCHFPEVGTAGAGEVVPLNAAAVAEALVKVLSSADLRQRMGEAGRALVRARFTWPIIAEQSIGAYARICRR